MAMCLAANDTSSLSRHPHTAGIFYETLNLLEVNPALKLGPLKGFGFGQNQGWLENGVSHQITSSISNAYVAVWWHLAVGRAVME